MKCVIWDKSLVWCGNKHLDIRIRSEHLCTYLCSVSLGFCC